MSDDQNPIAPPGKPASDPTVAFRVPRNIRERIEGLTTSGTIRRADNETARLTDVVRAIVMSVIGDESRLTRILAAPRATLHDKIALVLDKGLDAIEGEAKGG